MAKFGVLTACILTLSVSSVCALEIDERLVQAVIMCESRGDSNAVSSCGAVGLMQITPIVLQEYNERMPYEKDIDIFGEYAMAEREKALKNMENGYAIERGMSGIERNRVEEKYRQYNMGDLFDPAINVKIGTWYLGRIKDCYLKNKGTLDDILICYHDGYGNWTKWKEGKRQLGPQMKKYLKNVKKYMGGGDK